MRCSNLQLSLLVTIEWWTYVSTFFFFFTCNTATCELCLVNSVIKGASTTAGSRTMWIHWWHIATQYRHNQKIDSLNVLAVVQICNEILFVFIQVCIFSFEKTGKNVQSFNCQSHGCKKALWSRSHLRGFVQVLCQHYEIDQRLRVTAVLQVEGRVRQSHCHWDQ